MATQRVGKSAHTPQPLSATQRAKLCKERAELDEERLEFDRQARARKERIEFIERQLAEQLALDGVSMIDLPRWQFGTELVPGSFSYKDELLKEIGFDEFEARKAAVPQRERFFVRDKQGVPRRRAA